MNPSRRRSCAFTLIEVLVVVTIMAIASAIVAPRILSTGTMGVQAASRMLIADLLYAQNEAIAQQKSVRVTFTPASNRYAISYTDGTVLHVGWKGGDPANNNHSMDFDQDRRFKGVEITTASFGGGGVGPGVGYVEFDALGSPNAGGTIEMYYAGDGQTYEITVSDFTGRISIQRT